jgi:hypothetical protein
MKALTAVGLTVLVQSVTGGTLWLSSVMERRFLQRRGATPRGLEAAPSRGMAGAGR